MMIKKARLHTNQTNISTSMICCLSQRNKPRQGPHFTHPTWNHSFYTLVSLGPNSRPWFGAIKISRNTIRGRDSSCRFVVKPIRNGGAIFGTESTRHTNIN
uniref:Uncharacterized protein n=1 Tax=Cacopsylla melanoneura TaxID=428564 RepID=A0A8D9ELA8_9HEMI